MKTRTRKSLFVAATTAIGGLVLASCGGSSGDGDTHNLRIGVGGQEAMVYLPLTLAAELGHFEDAGLNVTIEDLGGGSDALAALNGGSVDVVSGYYDHTIQMQAMDRDVQAFVGMLNSPSLVLIASPEASPPVESISDLEGAVVGVSAPGSSTDFFLKYLLSENGMDAEAASVSAVGVAASAVAAMEQGSVDAAVMVDPAASELLSRAGEENVNILVDTRTPEGLQEVYGVDSYPASVIYTTGTWIESNPDVAQALTDAILETLVWIEDHSAQEIADGMPERFTQGSPEIYLASVEAMKDNFSSDGRLDEDGMQAALEILEMSLPNVASADIDLSTTYTSEFLD